MSRIDGLDEVLRNLDALEKRLYNQALRAADDIAIFLVGYAKSHHGTTPREARWIYRGYKIKGRGRQKGKQIASKYLRPAGIGWGDVTGALNRSTDAGIVSATRDHILVALTARQPYAEFVETISDGAWAWLWPAIDSNRDRIMDMWAKGLEL